MNTLRRIGLWFGSLLLSVLLFSVLLSLLQNGGFGGVPLIFRVTLMVAFPGLVRFCALHH